MKTELVTNVSHDLKTPLTAIITYVNLLKMEHDPERQKEYIDVLDRKSLRLKALIEDLFEISKASSRSVNLNIIEMDIVNLFKQVKLEMEEKITEANLDFRLDIPEENDRGAGWTEDIPDIRESNRKCSEICNASYKSIREDCCGRG